MRDEYTGVGRGLIPMRHWGSQSRLIPRRNLNMVVEEEVSMHEIKSALFASVSHQIDSFINQADLLNATELQISELYFNHINDEGSTRQRIVPSHLLSNYLHLLLFTDARLIFIRKSLRKAKN